MQPIAKSDGTLLEDHLTQTKEVAEEVYDNWLAPNLQNRYTKELVSYLAYMHDIGKDNLQFQSKPMPKPNMDTYHDYIGAVYLCHNNISKELAEIVGLHHGYWRGRNVNSKSYHNAVASDVIQDEYSPPQIQTTTEPQTNDLSVYDQTILAGYVSLCDWIASGGRVFQIPNRWVPKTMPFEEMFGFQPTQIQQEVIQNTDSHSKMVICETPTGSGKTEIALYLATRMAKEQGLTGVFFGTPTRASTNALYKRFRVWADEQNQSLPVYLADADKWSVKEFSELATTPNIDIEGLNNWWTTAKKEEKSIKPNLYREKFFARRQLTMLNTFICGTVDTLLRAGCRHRYLTLEHLGLAQKVVIIDEVHSYDAYMRVTLNRALAWLGQYGVPVILLSATMPEHVKRELVESYTGTKIGKLRQGYPMLTVIDEQHEIQEVELTKPKDLPKRIRWASNFGMVEYLIREKVDKGACVGIICDTVMTAQQLYRGYSKNYKTILLHSRYTPKDRHKLEEEVERVLGKKSTPEQRAGVIFIATQVAEQSLDFDVDLMITEPAPIDNLLQRAGRLFRHERTRPDCIKEPELWIMDEILNNGDVVYPQFLREKMAEVLSAETCIVQDKLAEWVNAGYELDNSKECRAYLEKLQGERTEAENYALLVPNAKRKKSVSYYHSTMTYETPVREGYECRVYLEDRGVCNISKKLFDKIVTLCNNGIVKVVDDTPLLEKFGTNSYTVNNEVFYYDGKVGFSETV